MMLIIQKATKERPVQESELLRLVGQRSSDLGNPAGCGTTVMSNFSSRE